MTRIATIATTLDPASTITATRSTSMTTTGADQQQAEAGRHLASRVAANAIAVTSLALDARPAVSPATA